MPCAATGQRGTHQEELAVVGLVVVLPAAREEPRVGRVAVVVTRVVRPAVAPLRVAGGRGGGCQALQRVRAVALELADAAERPVRQRVGRVPHLARGAHGHLHRPAYGTRPRAVRRIRRGKGLSASASHLMVVPMWLPIAELNADM